MKLRIHGNSLRFRLSQSEIQQLGQGQTVREEIPFAGGPSLTYALVKDPAAATLAATYQEHEVWVRVPLTLATQLVETDLVGVEHTQDLGDGKTLHLLIEKDFMCLPKRRNEDESDLYPNPAIRC